VKLLVNYTQFLESMKEKDMWDIIPQSVKELNELFKKSGKKLYLVGGSVRDFLTGDKPKDFDLATDALPDEVLSILGRKYRTNLQGKAFGVVVVYTDDQPMGMEIATFRSDIYDGKLGNSRNPEVKFTSIEEDGKEKEFYQFRGRPVRMETTIAPPNSGPRR
jgi:tRNA nucleotidyltransferase/poly(A) polymerase